MPLETETVVKGDCMVEFVEKYADPFWAAGLKDQVSEVEAESGSFALYPG